MQLIFVFRKGAFTRELSPLVQLRASEVRGFLTVCAALPTAFLVEASAAVSQHIWTLFAWATRITRAVIYDHERARKHDVRDGFIGGSDQGFGGELHKSQQTSRRHHADADRGRVWTKRVGDGEMVQDEKRSVEEIRRSSS